MARSTCRLTVALLGIIIGTSVAQPLSPAEIVNTTLGPIQGLRKSVKGKDVDVYYGVPYVKPPVEDLRFKRPEPADPWTEVLPTVTKPHACYQSIDTAFDRFPGVDMWNPNTNMSEDCLYLNLWVPRGPQPPATTMVWIYGGGLYSGSSSLDVYDGSNLAASQNVIVASMNYRLGPLGFLYTGTEDAPGNQGMLDQVQALKWIYDNVVNFGGQQESIALFGESAGAMSVGFHLLSPLSTKYFSRAILESGAPIMDIILTTTSTGKQRAEKLSTVLDCPVSSEQLMLQCLREEVSAERITDAQWLLPNGLFMNLPMAVVVDGHFLEDSPVSLMARGAVKDTELLMGTNSNEGFYFLLYFSPDLFPLNISGTPSISDADFKRLVHALNMNGEEAVDRAVIYEYAERMVPSQRETFRNLADEIAADRQFVCPSVDFATAFGSLGGARRQVYLYSFDQRLSSNPWPEWTGVMHGYEIEAVFGLPLQPQNYTQEEMDLADRVMGYWARFARSGNPNDDDVTWPKMTSQKAEYLRFSAQGDRVEEGLRYEQCSFRSTILPMLQQQQNATPVTVYPTSEVTECQPSGQGAVSIRPLQVITLLIICVVLASPCCFLSYD